MLKRLGKPFSLILGYVLLFFGMVALDQSTKFHAEKHFMTWYDTTDDRAYHSDAKRIFTLGTSPASLTDAGIRDGEPSKQWLDLHVTYVRNHGAAWGSFSNAPEFFRLWGFYLITLGVSAFVLYLFLTTDPKFRVARTAFVFILAGAAGNFLDRAMLKYVIDWIHFHWKILGWEYNFPVFNVADVSINIGMGLMIIDMLKNGSVKEKKKKESFPVA